MNRNYIDSLSDFIRGLSGTMLVEKPCKITKVYSQYLVDVEYYDNNKADMLYKVPVKHLQTQSSYIFLGLNVGDRGTVRFFDNDVADYYRSSLSTSTESRLHNINDNLFSLGYYPQTEQYIIPEGDVVIGTNSGAVISLKGDGITITGGSISINGSSVNIGENSTIDGKIFLEHTHSNGNEGNPTGGVL